MVPVARHRRTGTVIILRPNVRKSARTVVSKFAFAIAVDEDGLTDARGRHSTG